MDSFIVIWFVALLGLSTPIELKDVMHEFKTMEEGTTYAESQAPKMDYYFKGALGLVSEAPAGVSFVCKLKEQVIEKKTPDVKA